MTIYVTTQTLLKFHDCNSQSIAGNLFIFARQSFNISKKAYALRKNRATFKGN